MIYYLTSNESKYREAREFLIKVGIDIEKKSIDIPEIQATDSTEISKYSARYASKILSEKFFVMDRSLHITGLKGFPGPYVKYINNWFTEDNVISLFSNMERFDAYWQTSIAYNANGVISVFEGKLNGKIVNTPKGTNGWLFDKFFIPESFNETLAELSNKIRNSFWIRCSSWRNFADHLQKEKVRNVV